MSSITFFHGQYDLSGSIAFDVGDKPLECRGEWISLTDAMALVGAQPGEEDDVQAIIDSLTMLLAKYLGRNLLDCTYTDSFFRPDKHAVALINWPVSLVTSLRIDGVRQDMENYEIDMLEGVVYNKCGTHNRFIPCSSSSPPRGVPKMLST